jgi:hypothetical protein
MIQIKARFAGNGKPLSRAATQSWIILSPPVGLTCDCPRISLSKLAVVSKLAVGMLQRRSDASPGTNTDKLIAGYIGFGLVANKEKASKAGHA